MGKAIKVPNADFYSRNLGKVTKANIYIDGESVIFWDGTFYAYLADGTPVSANWSISGNGTLNTTSGQSVVVTTTGRGAITLVATYSTYTFTKVIQSTNDGYIKSGLVLYLDGADCNGTAWVDRISGRVFTLHNASVDGGIGVKFNTTAYSTAGASYASCSSVPSITPTAGTIEICAYRRAIRNSSEQENVCYNGTANRISYVVVANGTYVSTSNNTSNNAPRANISGRTLEKFTHSINSLRHYYNGAQGTLGANIAIPRYGSGIFIGCRTDGHYAFQGTVYQLRIYNRKLTAEEMLHNQQIDADKYGITLNP